jgi:hypothetical protein
MHSAGDGPAAGTTYQNPLYGMYAQDDDEEEEEEEDANVPIEYTVAYPGTEVMRVKVHEADWLLPDAGYRPTSYTAKEILAQPPWADPIPDTAKPLRFNAIDTTVNPHVDRTSFDGVYQVVEGLPRNPRGRTGLTGRGLLGRWGPNHAVDPVVARWAFTPQGDPVYLNNKRVLEVVTIRRTDNGKVSCGVRGAPKPSKC